MRRRRAVVSAISGAALCATSVIGVAVSASDASESSAAHRVRIESQGPSTVEPQIATPAQTYKPTPTSPLTVLITSLSPVAPKADSIIKISGTITNNTGDQLTGINLALGCSGGRIQDRAQLAEIANGNLNPGGQAVNGANLSIDSSLAPGASDPWSFELPAASFPFRNPGAYVLTVDAALNADGSINGSAQTFVPWYPKKDEVQPTKLVWLWPLAEAPNRDAQGILLDGRTPEELSPNGRLRQLLDVGLAAKMQPDWVIDPELIQTATELSNGYQVLGPGDKPREGDDSQEVSQWLTKAKQGLKAAQLYSFAYADPDVTALHRSEMNQDIVLATTPSALTLGRLIGATQAPIGIGWPPGKRTDQGTLGILQSAGARTVVLDSGAFPSLSDTGRTESSTAIVGTESGPLSGVITDRRLSNAFGTPESTASDKLAARQRFLAETAVITTEAPNQQRIIAVGPSARWNPNIEVVTELLAATQKAEWVERAPLSDLLKQTPTVNRVLAPMTGKEKRAGLSRSYLAKIRDQQRRLEELSAVLTDPASITEPFRAALLRASSGAWRTDKPQGTALVTRISDQLGQQIAGVRVLSNQPVTFSGGQGNVPITIANDLPQPVRVGVTMTGTPPVRLISSPMAAITIPANRKIQTVITAQVLGAGDLPVAVQLTTINGAPYGQPATIKLRTTAYARAATWVVSISFGLLTLLLIANSIRRRRAARPGGGNTPPTLEAVPDPTSEGHSDSTPTVHSVSNSPGPDDLERTD